MNPWGLVWQGLRRRPVRALLTLTGVAVAVGAWTGLSALGEGYRRTLGTELNRSGVQMMLVPLGCPYDAAARALKGRTVDGSLPATVLDAVRRDPDVAVASPMVVAAVPRKDEGRMDLWVGVDASVRELKPWWRIRAGGEWFPDRRSVVLGAEAASMEMRLPGDAFHSPELGATFRVCGVLERSGTSDDALLFLPLEEAQERFGMRSRLTAVAVRLRDPARIREVSARFQALPGAQVVTMTEMMGTFLNLLGSVRALMLAVSTVALAAGVLGLLQSTMSGVLERGAELALFRAVGATRRQVFVLVGAESGLLAAAGALLGIAAAAGGGPLLEAWVRDWIPLAPTGTFLRLEPAELARVFAAASVGGILAGLWPAWRASRIEPALGSRWEG